MEDIKTFMPDLFDFKISVKTFDTQIDNNLSMIFNIRAVRLLRRAPTTATSSPKFRFPGFANNVLPNFLKIPRVFRKKHFI